MSVNIEIGQETGNGELKLSFDSMGNGLKLSLCCPDGETTVEQVTLDQLEEFLFKAKRVLFFARYEEAAAEAEEGGIEDDDDDD